MNLQPLMERTDELRITLTIDEPPLSLVARLRLIPVEWFWWIVAAIKSPFPGKQPSEEIRGLKAGVLTLNEARKLALRSEDSDCHGE